MEENDNNSIKTFDCFRDPETLGLRWKRWLSGFELYADGKGLIIAGDNATVKQRRRALLLHLAGPDVQDIFSTLPDTGDVKDYDKAVDALNMYFIPKVDTTYARHCFRKLTQASGETVRQFATRLRRAAKDCNYGDETDNQIRDEILCKCSNLYIKRKLLEEGQGLTLERALEVAENCEKVDSQLAAMSTVKQEGADIANYVKGKKRDWRDYNKKQRTGEDKSCYRCGKLGHFGKDSRCPAKGKVCRKCGLKDHFEARCKSKPKEEKSNKVSGHRERRRTVNVVNPEEEEPVYAFVVGSTKVEKVEVIVGGCQLNMIIDSGASVNIVDKQTWEWLKKNRVVCTSSRSAKKLYTYASQAPLEVIGTFNCKISVGHHVVDAEVCVISGRGESLLGRDTAMKLGVLKMGVDVASVKSDLQDVGEMVQRKYPEVFKGVGKVKSWPVQLHIDPDVKPIAQQVRRIPFSMRPKVEERIKQLISQDIIEPVEGPTSWVNPVVIVPKPNGEIRLCVDMRRANEAIMRERHPIPTIDEITQGMNGSSVFSKLDLKWGYHQLELTPESRDITTFVTHCGLYRYKRLLFGVNSASEQYQHEIQRVLAGLEGQVNISDDIIVHGQNQEEHDTRLENVIKRLRDFGLTLNAEKCQFNMSRLTFVGMVLSEKGISCTEEKVRAVVEAREPESASEVRSFLGLVNYCGRFIPDLATISEPLRCLTKKGVPFSFGSEQKKSFQELKNRLSSSTTLGYFDKDAPTQVVADASPVGLGAVLTQTHKDGPRVISYASRSLTNTEKKYSQTEKEALALVWACEKFHQYVYGIPFELITDHKPLEVIYGSKSKPCARIERWVLRMQPYKFKVKYAPGSKNIADPLSRLVHGRQTTSEHEVDAENYVRFVAVAATPSAMTTREVEEASADDEELMVVRKSISEGSWDKMIYKQYIPCCDELCVVGQLVLRGTRVVIPKKLRPKVLSLAHEGHLGIVGTKQKLRSKVWWPGMEKDAEKYCKACYGCQLVSRPDFVEPIRTTTLPSGPWRDLAVDLLGPLPSGESVLVVIDYYSRYYEVVVMKSTVTAKIIESLEEIFCRHGLPESLTSDNGPQFISSEFEAYMDHQGIQHRRVTAKWPQANGEVERQNRSLLKRIQIAQAEKKDWKKELNVYLASYRSLPHPTTGTSPAELLFGRKIRTRLPELRDIHVQQEVRDRDHEQKNKGKMYADDRRNAHYSDILPGDKVLVQQERQNKFSTRFNPAPFTVVKKHGNSLVVRSKEGVQYSRNTSHCKKYVDNFESGGQPEIDQQELPARAESTDVEYTSNETDLLQDAAPKQEETVREEMPLREDRRSSSEGGTGTVGGIIGQASNTLKDNVPVR